MEEPLYSLSMVIFAFFAAALLVMCGTALRNFIPFLERTHMPAAVIGGLVGLVLGPQVLGEAVLAGTPQYDAQYELYAMWKQLPGYLISVVFAALMMGKALPSGKAIWKESSPHLVVGYTVAWGQYVVGAALALFVLIPMFDGNGLNAAMIAIGFQGGYGTAAGLGDTYDKLGFYDGYDIALGMATAGKVAAILVGLGLVNIAVGKQKMKSPQEQKIEDTESRVPARVAKEQFKQQRQEQYFSADSLVLHCAVLCLAIGMGYCLREFFTLVESMLVANPEENGIMQYIPLFPMALLGGVGLQFIISRTRFSEHLNAHHIHSISHSFLDLLIVVAIATLSLKTLAANWHILLLLIGAGVGWNLIVFFFIGPRLYHDEAWTRGVGDFAHATGATTTGLLLMKVIDPNDTTGARSSFNMKQTFYEPIVGGGFLTALALPLMHSIGLMNTMILFGGLLIFTLIFGMRSIKRQRKAMKNAKG